MHRFAHTMRKVLDLSPLRWPSGHWRTSHTFENLMETVEASDILIANLEKLEVLARIELGPATVKPKSLPLGYQRFSWAINNL
ncbi:jg26277 [Pararge aegeria aegeria]|uniref:Jg26277 protein n=1 Tax=Pararge aegeria aegeria TaxID=348720 RepID=A0A8S4QIP5_9NEOP|nr:jg26277 [Pararge aegeria aegeria]